MILRLSSSAQRASLLAAALFSAAFLSCFSIRNARAEHFAGLETPEGFSHAVELEPGNARNWFLLGHYWLYNLEDPDVARAIRAFQTSASYDPHSADTWLDLASAYESQGNLASARDAFRSAKQAYPLSAEGAWRYGNFLLRVGEQDAAFAEIRHAVEADPKLAAEAFSRCMRVHPDLRDILDRVLPPSRDGYLSVMLDLLGDRNTGDALIVWSRLAALHPQLSMRDVFPLVEALMLKKQLLLARQVWDQGAIFAGLTHLDPPGSLVWDGGFESGFFGAGFAWRLPPPFGEGVQTSLDESEKHSGKRSLRLLFDGKHNVHFRDLCQYVIVQPSTAYRFSAWVRTQALTTDQGIRFRLNAISTLDIRGTQPWTNIEIPWTSGEDVNELQLCVQR
ncbi:MAG: tetratricopeptide repeat protein, partial [Candidatus Acidiferrum sp.]